MTRLRSLALLVALAGCAPLPALTFVSGSDDAASPSPVSDATIVEDAGGRSNDAGEGADSQPIDTDPNDDGGDGSATIQCGPTMVANCTQCAGSPLRCKGMRDECVPDCATCAAGWFPCIHCAMPGSPPHGVCLPVGAKGLVACTQANLCGCASPTDCPAIEGAAETCDDVNGHMRCLTCGSPTTSGASCTSPSGGAGVCRIAAGSAPTCD